MPHSADSPLTAFALLSRLLPLPPTCPVQQACSLVRYSGLHVLPSRRRSKGLCLGRNQSSVKIGRRFLPADVAQGPALLDLLALSVPCRRFTVPFLAGCHWRSTVRASRVEHLLLSSSAWVRPRSCGMAGAASALSG